MSEPVVTFPVNDDAQHHFVNPTPITLIDAARLDLYEAADLSPTWVRWLGASGIDLAEAEAHAGVVAKADAVFDDAGFYLDDRDGGAAIVIEALDVDSETVIDLVGWPIGEPDKFKTALGVAEGLGVAQIANPASYFNRRPLPVHRTPLAWLQASCRGVVVLDRVSAPRWLGEARGALAGEDVEHGRELARLLHRYFDPRRIVAPLRGAA